MRAYRNNGSEISYLTKAFVRNWYCVEYHSMYLSLVVQFAFYFYIWSTFGAPNEKSQRKSNVLIVSHSFTYNAI
jgi:hypothetical protein